MTLRLTPEDEQVLAVLAKADGISKQEARYGPFGKPQLDARRRHMAHVSTLSAAARERYAAVLDRLGR